MKDPQNPPQTPGGQETAPNPRKENTPTPQQAGEIPKPTPNPCREEKAPNSPQILAGRESPKSPEREHPNPPAGKREPQTHPKPHREERTPSSPTVRIVPKPPPRCDSSVLSSPVTSCCPVWDKPPQSFPGPHPWPFPAWPGPISVWSRTRPLPPAQAFHASGPQCQVDF